MASGKGVIRLEWDTFQANIAEQYQSLRGAHDFTDVTLVCKDLSKTEAHRIILASGSTFFNGLLGGGDQVKGHPHPMIFLPGVTRATLAPLLDFFYSGEASVAQEDLQDFLILSKSLGVKGLIQTEENTDGTEEGELNLRSDQKEYKTPASKNKAWNPLRYGAEEGQKLKVEALEETHFGEETTEDDLFVTLNGVSTCKVCQLTIEKRSELSEHMKQHLEEMQSEDSVSERKKKRKTSRAWRFFTPNDSLSASCSLCNVEIKTSGGTTSSLHNHLKGKHKLEYSAMELDGVSN